MSSSDVSVTDYCYGQNAGNHAMARPGAGACQYGTAIYQDTWCYGVNNPGQGHAAGQVAKRSRAYFAGAAPVWSTLTYDPVGRVQTVTAADGGVTTTTYARFKSTVTNAKNQNSVRISNAIGELERVEDAAGAYSGECEHRFRSNVNT